MELGRRKISAPKIGENVEVRELPLKEAFPLIPLVEQEDKTEFILKLLSSAVLVDGKPIGYERISQLGTSALPEIMAIVPVAVELNGFGDKTAKKA
jgi:hypothetical protein